ncbi:MAG: hypothetical protein OEY85_05555, partial [Rhodospirillales bacterium]|nr:hypothetical protein [Rhodospirillales bacterium]
MNDDASTKPGSILITGHDIGIAVGMPFLAMTAWLLPQRTWQAFARAIAPFLGAALSRNPREIKSCVGRIAGSRTMPLSPQEIAKELVACEIQKNFQTMRDYLPWRWRPRITLKGNENIQAALAAGKGVIVWDTHFYFA